MLEFMSHNQFLVFVLALIIVGGAVEIVRAIMRIGG
jgi:hypothetical protein